MSDFEFIATDAAGLPVTVEISKVGGGTVGRRYEGLWEYRVMNGGRVVIEGTDLYTGTPKTHVEAARIALDYVPEDDMCPASATPQSGYTPCACRDCMDATVSSDVTHPELCELCTEAGCESYPPSEEAWRARPVASDYECERDDAYEGGE